MIASVLDVGGSLVTVFVIVVLLGGSILAACMYSGVFPRACACCSCCPSDSEPAPRARPPMYLSIPLPAVGEP
jgi:hypothetical protein